MAESSDKVEEKLVESVSPRKRPYSLQPQDVKPSIGKAKKFAKPKASVPYEKSSLRSSRVTTDSLETAESNLPKDLKPTTGKAELFAESKDSVPYETNPPISSIAEASSKAGEKFDLTQDAKSTPGKAKKFSKPKASAPYEKVSSRSASFETAKKVDLPRDSEASPFLEVQVNVERLKLQSDYEVSGLRVVDEQQKESKMSKGSEPDITKPGSQINKEQIAQSLEQRELQTDTDISNPITISEGFKMEVPLPQKFVGETGTLSTDEAAELAEGASVEIARLREARSWMEDFVDLQDDVSPEIVYDVINSVDPLLLYDSPDAVNIQVPPKDISALETVVDLHARNVFEISVDVSNFDEKDVCVFKVNDTIRFTAAKLSTSDYGFEFHRVVQNFKIPKDFVNSEIVARIEENFLYVKLALGVIPLEPVK